MTKSVLIITFLTGMIVPYFAQQNEKKEIKREPIVNYWDKDKKHIRSKGYLNVSGFSDVGQKTGRWVYYYKNGEVEESSVYVNGRYQGKVVQM